MRRLGYALVALLTVVCTASFGYSAEKGSFTAKLSGREAVPRVTTQATGKAEFKLSKDGKELTYKLTVTDIENVTAAHIHLGKKGKDGPPLAGLFAGPKKEGKFSGVLAAGILTEKDLIGSVKDKPLTELVKLIKSGSTYVNVHTDKYPGGELRGQIR
ncbi:MAG: CHRD domain-containing protein [Desulfobacteraceae bacterium]|nr:CHRD domain-containing protein [Desulfobacteraceae bacterium]